MIKENELRIGNLVTHLGKDWSYRNHLTVPNKDFNFEWDSHDWYALGESTLFLESIEPIKLTTEWLEKFGFKGYSEGAYYYHKKDIDDEDFLVIGSDNMCSINNISHISYHDDNIIFLRKIDNVHQLQNLWFSLKGEELEYV